MDCNFTNFNKINKNDQVIDIIKEEGIYYPCMWVSIKNLLLKLFRNFDDFFVFMKISKNVFFSNSMLSKNNMIANHWFSKQNLTRFSQLPTVIGCIIDKYTQCYLVFDKYKK